MGTWTVAASQQYNLTTAVSGSGTVSPPSDLYGSGSVVSLAATPASGYRFTGFSGNVNSSSNPLNVTVNSAMTETANFAPSGGGTVTQTVTTPPAGLQVVVDGVTTCPPICVYQW